MLVLLNKNQICRKLYDKIISYLDLHKRYMRSK